MNNVALLSTAFSGSTLVSMLVCSHPNAIGFGDTYNFQFVNLCKTSCTCGATPSLKCPVRVSIESTLKAEGDSFTWMTSNPTPIPNFLRSSKLAGRIFRDIHWLYIYRGLPVALRNKLFRQFYHQNARFLAALEAIDKKTHYFDGCKSLVRLELLRTVYPDIKVVHLIKNPKAYLHSVLQRKKKSYRTVVDYWIQYHGEAVRLGNCLGPDRYLLVTFEELTKSPEATISNVYRFMGLPEREEPFSGWVNFNDIHVIGSLSKNVFKQVDQKIPKWKSELTKEQFELYK